MELIIILAICALACWYIFRRFSKAFKSNNPACGCDGCGSCTESHNPHADKDKTNENR